MREQENMLLKVGSLFILIGGIVSGLLGIAASATTLLAVNSLDKDTMSGLDSYIQQESGGMFGSDEAVAVVGIAVFAVIAISAVMMLIRIIVGVMGLSRARNPQKYRFFLIWGVILLIIGFFGLGQLFSLRGIVSACGGIVGPVLFIIGGAQQNKAVNAEPME